MRVYLYVGLGVGVRPFNSVRGVGPRLVLIVAVKIQVGVIGGEP